MFDKLIEGLPPIMRLLTFRRTVYIITWAIVFALLYVLVTERSMLMKSFVATNIDTSTSNQIFVSTETTQLARELLNRSAMVTAVQIVNIDIRTNTRSTAMFIAKTGEFEQLFKTAMVAKQIPTPLLTRDPENNTRFAAILSGKFDCTPIEKTILSKIVPGIDKYAKTICSVSIPPYTGKFSGYLNLMLDRDPDPDEMLLVETIGRNFSTTVYVRELSSKF